MAGPAAEGMLSDLQDVWETLVFADELLGTTKDLSNALESYGFANPDAAPEVAETFVVEVSDRVVTWMTNHWMKVDLVADALLRHETLTDSSVYRLIEEDPDPLDVFEAADLEQQLLALVSWNMRPQVQVLPGIPLRLLHVLEGSRRGSIGRIDAPASDEMTRNGWTK